jgi:nitrite reductase/ring-hydroxylating ferredoxin subunit
MSTSIRVADLAELPPGKGKVIALGEHQITVYNDDGVFYASSTRRGRLAEAPFTDTSADCSQHGLVFDVFAEDSPARLRAGTTCTVRVEEETVWLILSDDKI